MQGKVQSLVLSVADPAAGKRRAEKHEICAVAFGGHLFYDLFLQGGNGGGGGGMAPHPLYSLLFIQWSFPKLEKEFTEFSKFRESDKSLKHELESI